MTSTMQRYVQSKSIMVHTCEMILRMMVLVEIKTMIAKKVKKSQLSRRNARCLWPLPQSGIKMSQDVRFGTNKGQI